jgi:hypothetical protein
MLPSSSSSRASAESVVERQEKQYARGRLTHYVPPPYLPTETSYTDPLPDPYLPSRREGADKTIILNELIMNLKIPIYAPIKDIF